MTFPACGDHLPQNVSTRGLFSFTESSLYFFLCLFLLSCSPPHLSHNMRREVLLGWSERRRLSPHLNRVYSFPCYSGVIRFGDANMATVPRSQWSPRSAHLHLRCPSLRSCFFPLFCFVSRDLLLLLHPTLAAVSGQVVLPWQYQASQLLGNGRVFGSLFWKLESLRLRGYVWGQTSYCTVLWYKDKFQRWGGCVQRWRNR